MCFLYKIWVVNIVIFFFLEIKEVLLRVDEKSSNFIKFLICCFLMLEKFIGNVRYKCFFGMCD